MSLISELKRRNVLRVATAYVVVAWLVIQVVETIFPAFGFGDATVRIVTIAFAIGLVPVLIFAWAFELTPEGLKKDKDVDRSLAMTRQTDRKLDRIIMVVLALALGYFAFDKFVLSVERETEITTKARQAGAEQALENARLGMWNEKSIAVLPFINRSKLDEDEYFTDGMHDELLTRLAHIAELKVISRTSVMRYRDTDKSVPEIARELSVATILEGGVQRVGKQVRINVQLIDAHTDEHLWAQIFDRELTTENLFAIQSEISRAIADAMQAELSPTTLASIEAVPTNDAEAYDLYLQAIKARTFFQGSDTFKEMKPLLERAVALDPDFLRAQVLLAETYGRLLWTSADPDRIYGAKTLELVTDIRRRWPDRVEGHLALGHYHYTVERDYARALAEYKVVERVIPNDVEMLIALTGSLKRLGRFEEALDYARRLVILDPENSLVAQELMFELRFNGFREEAIAVAEEGVKKFPEDASWQSLLAQYSLSLLGDVKSYLAFGEHLHEAGDWASAGRELTWLLYGQGEVEKALEHAAARMHGEFGWNQMTAELDAALILRAEGRDDEAQAAADHALAFVKSKLESEQPFPNTNSQYWYTRAAYCAAVAGDLEAVTEYRASAIAATENDFIFQRLTAIRNAHIDALQGEAAAGWASIAPHLGPHYLTAEYVAVSPFLRYLFGDVPAFQEFIARARI